MRMYRLYFFIFIGQQYNRMRFTIFLKPHEQTDRFDDSRSTSRRSPSDKQH